MTRARTTLRTLGMLGASALVVAGCGGGETPPAGGATTPTPAPGTTDPLVGDPGATTPGAIDPLTGQPVAPTSTDVGATATIPSLVGDDISGGLAETSTSAIFEPGAIDPTDADAAENAKETETASNAATEAKDPVVETTKYSGAKIYVDGIVHDVSINGVFPKGNPVFRLVSVGAGTIELELVAGEFTSGGGVGTLLDKGELVSLVNGSEQLTYRVKYLRPVVDTGAISF